MGIVGRYLEQRLAEELKRRRVLVWYDPDRQWVPFVAALLGRPLTLATQALDVRLSNRATKFVMFNGSHYEVLRACEPLTAGDDPIELLVYVPGERPLETLSPLRELECLGGDKEPYHRDLGQIARSAFYSAGLAESKIDELLQPKGITFEYLDAISVDGDAASPLAPIFGSGREIDVIPQALTNPEKLAQASATGLLQEIATLSERGLGLPLDSMEEAAEMRTRLARLLLVGEFRNDLKAKEPVEISQIPAPRTDEQRARVRSVCARLRADHPSEYEQLAKQIEGELGLARADVDALALGSIDTFPFEEARLLEACDALIAAGDFARALAIVVDRSTSFWTSVRQYPQRHAAWRACEALARLGSVVSDIRSALERPPSKAGDWIEAYAADGGWHRADRLFREARALLRQLDEDGSLERSSDRVLSEYEMLLNDIASGFTRSLKEAQFDVPGVLPQTDVFPRHVGRPQGKTAYLLVDAFRYEMGVELAERLNVAGAKGVRCNPAMAAIPTITPVGMAAVLPGASRSFSLAETPDGVVGAINGRALVRVEDRMDHAKAEIPGVVDVLLDNLMIGSKADAVRLDSAPLVIVRSVEIDQIGEGVGTGVAQRVMGTVLHEIERAVKRLAIAGITRFVITADHGHLFASRKGEDMRIDPPEGGRTVDLHRRCWVGRGGSTPSACLRVHARDLGYDSDLDMVFPKGTAVFKSGGDLAYYHGGLSLQELIIPVVSFDLKIEKPKAKRGGDLVLLESVPRRVTNRIFSVALMAQQGELLEPLRVKVIAVSGDDGRVVAQTAFADQGLDPDSKEVTLTVSAPVSVGLLLEDEQTSELRIVVMDPRTGRVLKDSEPILVDVVR
jgi:hypothetical protein